MFQIQDLNYSIGDRQLLNGVNWVIGPGKRAALIGPNGAGKTTLLRILNEELEYHSGSIVKPKDFRIGYLPQEEIALEGRSILHTVLEGQKEIRGLEEQIKKLHHHLETPGENEKNLLKQLGDLEHRFEMLGGYHLEAMARNILTGLGFSKTDLERPITEFSGGWRMRVYLALLLVRQPDLLLLDEPTNHLDLPSLEWLEQYLIGFRGSIILVSHDRFFIDRLAQEIAELDRGRLSHYAGNYHFYEKEKDLRESLLLKRFKEQQAERERQEKFINRFRYKDSKASQVQSRIKLLEKMETIEITPPPPRLNFGLKVETPSYRDVLAVDEMWFRYEEEWVLKNIDLNIYRGDRVCLIGANGAGKTTFTKLMAGQLKPCEGSLVVGERVKMGYYAQHQVETLNLEATVYEEVASTVATSLGDRIRDVLGVFQFHGDDVYKRIKVLSGGEKARVSLAKILISPVNFLVMDEPTNHLDKHAKEALEHALANYNGTLLLISHDRYFLDKLVNRVVEVKNGEMATYDGNYTYYLEKRAQVAALKKENGKTNGKTNGNGEAKKGEAKEEREEAGKDQTGGKKTKEQKRLEAEARQAVSKELNVWKKRVTGLEDKIHELEERKEHLERELATPETYDDSRLTAKLQREYGQVGKDMDTYTAEWEEAHEKLDELVAQSRIG